MMRRGALRKPLLALAPTLALALALGGAAAQAQDRPVIATATYALSYFAERLAGDVAEVRMAPPPGVDPAFWRPAIRDIAALQAADLIVLNGAGYASWTTKASLPRSRTVTTAADLSDEFIQTDTVTHSHGADGAHSHAALASVTWLDFDLAAAQAEALAKGMTRRMPQAREGLQDRLAALQADLAALDAQAVAAGAALKGQQVLATHPRYQYFARAYDVQIEALSWDAGAQPDADQLADLAARVAETGATVLIWEGRPPEQALADAAALGLRSVIFPPLARRPASGDFLDGMRRALTDLAAAAQG